MKNDRWFAGCFVFMGLGVMVFFMLPGWLDLSTGFFSVGIALLLVFLSTLTITVLR